MFDPIAHPTPIEATVQISLLQEFHNLCHLIWMKIAEAHPPTANFRKLLILLEEGRHSLSLATCRYSQELETWLSLSQSETLIRREGFVLVAEGTLGGQTSSSSLDSGKPYGFWCVPFMGILLFTLQSSFDSCQFSTLVCLFSTAFLSPHLFAMILLLFKNTQFFSCCSNEEPWMKHFYC